MDICKKHPKVEIGNSFDSIARDNERDRLIHHFYLNQFIKNHAE